MGSAVCGLAKHFKLKKALMGKYCRSCHCPALVRPRPLLACTRWFSRAKQRPMAIFSHRLTVTTWYLSCQRSRSFSREDSEESFSATQCPAALGSSWRVFRIAIAPTLPLLLSTSFQVLFNVYRWALSTQQDCFPLDERPSTQVMLQSDALAQTSLLS